MSLVNYELAMLLGCWSAVTVMFYTIIILILIPVALYIMYKRHRARTAQIRRVRALKNDLIVKPYDSKMFPCPKECCICLNEF